MTTLQYTPLQEESYSITFLQQNYVIRSTANFTLFYKIYYYNHHHAKSHSYLHAGNSKSKGNIFVLAANKVKCTPHFHILQHSLPALPHFL
jgi:hypothetical protein